MHLVGELMGPGHLLIYKQGSRQIEQEGRSSEHLSSLVAENR